MGVATGSEAQDAKAVPETKALVDHPNHYLVQIDKPQHGCSNGVECIDVIEALSLSYNVGTAFAYLWRSRKKGTELLDLQKAVHHLNREIVRLCSLSEQRNC